MIRSISAASAVRQMRSTHLILAALLSLVTFTHSASAQVDDKPLSDSYVKGFAGAMTDLAEWASRKDDQFKSAIGEGSGTGENAGNYFAALSDAWGDSETVRKEAEAIVAKHGFASMAEWQAISERIMSVYAAIEVAKSQDSVDSGLNSLMKNLESSGLSEEQKAAMKAALGDAKEKMQQYQEGISPADRQVVERNRPMLDELFNRLRSGS